jgi:ELWxxDGT repeat protein
VVAIPVPVDMLKDINTTATGAGPSHLTTVGSTLFFTQSSPGLGEELWKTDGTAAGTVLVKDINPGEPSSAPDGLTDVNGTTLYFFADNGVNGIELWKSDGTTAGTQLVKDVYPGPDSSYAAGMTAVGGIVFFAADDSEHGWELWKTDGSDVGTGLVAEVNPTGGSGAWNLTEFDGELYFSATDGVSGEELWRSNGTTVEPAADTWPGIDGSSPTALEVVDLVPDGPTLFFQASDDVSGPGLWKSDGTTTELVAVTGTLSSPIVGVAGSLYFGAQGEMWTSDGTEAGTHEVKAEYPGVVDTYIPADLTGLGGALVFRATNTDDPDIRGLWQTDGSDTATVRLANGGTAGYADGGTARLGSAVLFEIVGAGSGSELWTTDGTTTALVKDIRPGAASSEPHELTVLGGNVYFVANDGVVGDELWRSDGTAGGTVLVRDVNTATLGSDPDYFASIGGTFYFTAVDAAHGRELWKSNGTAAGTVLLKDVLLGPDSSDAAESTAVGTTLYFTAIATAGSPERVLWKSDGTAANTVQVPLQAFPNAPSGPTGLTAAGGLLYFAAAAHNGLNSLGQEPWRTDGTAAGTVLLKDVWPGGPGAGGGGGFLGGFSYVNGTVLFPARSTSNDVELWKTDGSPAGTVLVKDINPGLNGSAPGDFMALGSTTYFTADDGATGRTLWRTNGTTAGTVQAVDAVPGSTADEVSQLTAMGGSLFFTANDLNVPGDSNVELWTSDGTAAGTHRVVDLGPTQYGSAPTDLTELGGWLYFTADNGVVGRELWRSGGTAVGTTLVKDVNPGSGGAMTFDRSIVTAGSLLLLAADDGVHGSELWQSDGTSAGTELARDIRLGSGAGLPYFTAARAALGQLFFSADDGVHGRELWRAMATLDTDLDDDGIANDIDTLPTTPSADFTDTGVPGGKTSGTILGLTGGAGVSIVDAPIGVHITVTGSANARARVQISSRPTSEKLAPGLYQLDDPYYDTTLSVLSGGPAEIEAPLNGTLVTITVHEGATVTFTETVSVSGALTDLVVEPDSDNLPGTVQINGVDVTAGSELALGGLSAKVSQSQGSFLLAGTFTPGPSSDGVQRPADEPVLLKLGPYTFAVPAASFARTKDGAYLFNGTLGGVKLSLQLKAAKRGVWEVKANGKPVSLTSPVTVGLRIGDDQAVTTVRLS